MSTNQITVERPFFDADPLITDFGGSTERGLGDAFEGVLDAYRQEGFDAGYSRAIHDLRADFVLLAAEFLREHPDQPGLREALGRFECHIDQQSLRNRPRSESFVDGGLGI